MARDLMDWPTLASRLAPATASWTGAFFCARLWCRGRSGDFANRVVSIVHALVAVALAVPALDWGAPLASVGQPNSLAAQRCLEVSLAYFAYDTLCSLAVAPDAVGLAHHVCTLAGLLVGVRTGACGTELVACLLLMEVSNPSMHLNQLLKEAGRSDSALATANGVLFALLFFLCRLVVGPIVVAATLRSPSTPLVVKAGGVGILAVSLVWFRTILKIALYKLSKARGKAGTKVGAKAGAKAVKQR